MLYRLKVPGGWLVLRAFARTDLADSMIFYPDPNHEWGASIDDDIPEPTPPRDCPDCDYPLEEHRSMKSLSREREADDCSFTQEELRDCRDV